MADTSNLPGHPTMRSSVAMLDTDIDSPEIVNGVFFKMVKSSPCPKDGRLSDVLRFGPARRIVINNLRQTMPARKHLAAHQKASYLAFRIRAKRHSLGTPFGRNCRNMPSVDATCFRRCFMPSTDSTF